MSILAVASVLVTVQAFDIHSLLNSDPQIDPNAKACQLTQAQVDELLSGTATEAKSHIVISSKLSATFADNSAQLLSSSGFQVCETDASQLAGDVVVILQPGAKSIVYYGKRNAETLNLFVQKLSARYASAGPMFNTITNKMERKAFERLVVPKVVAFYPDPTTDVAFAEFQQAARQLAPNPPFYVVHDAHVSFTFFKSTLNRLKSLDLVLPNFTLSVNPFIFYIRLPTNCDSMSQDKWR